MPHTLMFSHLLKGRKFENSNPSIQVIGLGAAGTNVIGALFNHHSKAKLTSINTDWTQLSAQPADNKILIGVNETHGQGCGGNRIKGRNAALESLSEIKQIFHENDLVFLIAGLGNGTATGALPIIAKEAKRHNCLVIAFCIVPLFLHQKSTQHTHDVLREIKNDVDTAIIIDQNQLMKIIPTATLTNAFALTNLKIATAIDSILSLVRDQELISINYSHIKKVFETGSIGTIAISQEDANTPANQLINKALGDTLCDYDLSKAQKAIIAITAGEAFSLGQLDALASHTKSLLAPDADIQIAPKISKHMLGKVRTTLILTGRDARELNFNHDLYDVLSELRKQ